MKDGSKKKVISKIDAATSQLETAIKLFFEGRDILSAYTLCCAADGILEGLWQSMRHTILLQRGFNPNYPPPEQQSMKEIWDDHLVPEFKKESIPRINATQNFLKHADKDPNSTHEFDPFNETSIRIMATCRNFSLITGNVTPAIKSFQSWSAAIHPNLLKKDSYLRKLVDDKITKQISPPDALAAGLMLLKKECPELFTEDQRFIRQSKYSFKIPL